MSNSGVRFFLALGLLFPACLSWATTLDYQGYGFESGGFPPSAPGDELRIPFITTTVGPELGLDLATTELTGWISGLVSQGAEDIGDGVQRIVYGSGRIGIYRDMGRDHDFGTWPPSLLVPATFTNGELCLGGTLRDFVLYLDTESLSGAYEGLVHFDTGACLAALGAASADGYTFGGVLGRAMSGSVPAGYDLSVDGFLEARKKPVPACPFACIELTAARLDFPRTPPRRFGPRDGKFRIDGVFTLCPDFGPLDPSQVEVRVRVGDYVQVFPEGSMVLEDDYDDADVEWEYLNPNGVQTITELEIELEADGAWEFEIFGRGIPRATLLPNGLQLEVELTISTMNGTAQAMLVQKKNRLRFRGDDRPCPVPRAPDAPGAGGLLALEALRPELFPAAPNPFNAATTIRLRTVESGAASLSVFDMRGRLVRVLHGGALSAGEHRYVWDGRDEQGRGVASGVFVVRVQAPGIATTRKLVLAK